MKTVCPAAAAAAVALMGWPSSFRDGLGGWVGGARIGRYV